MSGYEKISNTGRNDKRTSLADVVIVGLFVIILFVGFYVSGVFDELGLVAILFIGLIIMSWFGTLVKYIKENPKLSDNELCYGYVRERNIESAHIGVYSTLSGRVIDLKKVEDVGYLNLSEGDYVMVKFFKGTPKVLSIVDSLDEVPDFVREMFEERYNLNDEDRGRNLDDIDTHNWTVTEEAYSDKTAFRINEGSGYYEEDEKGSFIAASKANKSVILMCILFGIGILFWVFCWGLIYILALKAKATELQIGCVVALILGVVVMSVLLVSFVRNRK